MEPVSEKALLARVIDRNGGEIVGRWLARVEAAVANTPGMELTQLRNGIPDYLSAVVELLRQDVPAD